MGKIGNTLAMLKLLETGRKYTVKELAERIEVTPRMIKSYKYELEKAGIYIDSISGIYGGYIYNKRNNYDVTFNIKDVNNIEKVLPLLDGKLKSDMEVLLEKIRTIVIYSTDSIINDIDEEEIQKKYKIISKAIKNKQPIQIEYNNNVKNIIPQNFSYYKNIIYFTGYSTSDEELRTYNLNKTIIK